MPRPHSIGLCERAASECRQRQVDPRKLIFIDETCSRTNMSAPGAGVRGQEAAEQGRSAHWTLPTFIAAPVPTRSSRPSQNSSAGCVTPDRDAGKRFGEPSATSSKIQSRGRRKLSRERRIPDMRRLDSNTPAV